MPIYMILLLHKSVDILRTLGHTVCMTPHVPRRRSERALESRRLKAVEGFRSGQPLAAIARRLGVTRQAVHKWYQRYRRAGLEGLYRRPRPGRPRKLTSEQERRLATWLQRSAKAYGFQTQEWTAQRVADLIRVRFRVRYDRDHLSRVLRRLGFSWHGAKGWAQERTR
jgi:transposase